MSGFRINRSKLRSGFLAWMKTRATEHYHTGEPWALTYAYSRGWMSWHEYCRYAQGLVKPW